MSQSVNPLLVTGIVVVAIATAPIARADEQPSPGQVQDQEQEPVQSASQPEATPQPSVSNQPPAWLDGIVLDVPPSIAPSLSVDLLDPVISPLVPPPPIGPASVIPIESATPFVEAQPEAVPAPSVPPQSVDAALDRPATSGAGNGAGNSDVSGTDGMPAPPLQATEPSPLPDPMPLSPERSTETIEPNSPFPSSPLAAPDLASPDLANPDLASPEFVVPMSPGSAPAASDPGPLMNDPLRPSASQSPSPEIGRLRPAVASPDLATAPALLDITTPATREALKAIDAPIIPVAQPLPEQWWQQGAQSPIAIAIGNAEGTRTVDGGKSQAYYWHQDPGNGADNFGTFSYQHLSDQEKTPVDRQVSSDQKRHQSAREGLPETADRRQMAKLQRMYQQLLTQAHLRGLALSELEILNGLDLANQSEEAALDTWGYIDRLIQAKGRTADPEKQIEQARTWSYWHPRLNRWDAAGLGNRYDSILHDQQRRSTAVKEALAAQQRRQVIAHSANLLTLEQPEPTPIAQVPLPSPVEHRQAIEQLTAAIMRFEIDRDSDGLGDGPRD